MTMPNETQPDHVGTRERARQAWEEEHGFCRECRHCQSGFFQVTEYDGDCFCRHPQVRKRVDAWKVACVCFEREEG